MPATYDPAEIERTWQARWESDALYQVDEDEGDRRPKRFMMTMFPYTSGDLHIGHWYAETPADALARFARMRGDKVLHPIGFDAFGLPAENAAIKRGIHPREWTEANIAHMRTQLKSTGCGYDWRREVVTSRPDYYRWTQWLFLQLYRGGLAYRALAPVNWCPSCRTTLANEQVRNGACERCDSVVTKRDLEQWFFRITRYADQLLDHSQLDWPEKINAMQTNWIGRSEGAEVDFDIAHHGLSERVIRAFTTRPDTLYGATFMVLAPEHPLVARLTGAEQRSAVERYVEQARRATEIDRLSTEREKTGVFIGADAVNPLTEQRIPIYIADYVLLSYGTGAIMAVPAHDERDFAFARAYGLPIAVVIAPPGYEGDTLDKAYVGEGTMVNSGRFDGLTSRAGKQAVTAHLGNRGIGQAAVTFRIRDWLISRQRYWGAPIPIVYCAGCGIVPVPEEQLPVLLPDDVDFRPTGESPLRSHEGFVNTTCAQCHGPARRETDTLDTFMCSSWYQYRYTSPGYEQAPFDPARLAYWMPVDVYTGGAEHAVMHLLYARFFHKALRDLGLVPGDEPYVRLYNQGTITYDHAKMSKSRGNVIDPDHLVAEYGADAVRLFLMFLGPWDQGGDWSDAAIRGMPRFLNRVWGLHETEALATRGPAETGTARELVSARHVAVQRVTRDLEAFAFNTAIAAAMELSNTLSRTSAAAGAPEWQEAYEALLLCLAPFAPHLTEELWHRRGRPYSIHTQAWPTFDASLTEGGQLTLVVQVNGKLRDRNQVDPGVTEEEAKRLAWASARVRPHVEGKAVVREIVVLGKLVNLVVR